MENKKRVLNVHARVTARDKGSAKIEMQYPVTDVQITTIPRFKFSTQLRFHSYRYLRSNFTRRNQNFVIPTIDAISARKDINLWSDCALLTFAFPFPSTLLSTFFVFPDFCGVFVGISVGFPQIRSSHFQRRGIRDTYSNTRSNGVFFNLEETTVRL